MKDAGKILFVIYAAPIAYSHGVAVLSACLKEAGYSTALFVANGNLEEFKVQLGRGWRAVCFAHCIKKDFDLLEPYHEAALASGVEVLMGGTYHRRNNPNRYDGVVKICRGDGERIADYFDSGDTAIFDHPQRCQNLDALPMADYALFEQIPFDGHIKNFPEMRKLPYTISRGCVGKCSFCEVRHQGGGVRIRYTALDDLDRLAEQYNPELWFFTDELFPYHNQRFMASFLARVNRPFFAFIRADIPRDTLAAMLDVGMVGCAFGVESGDEAYRNEVLGKGLTDTEIHRTVELLRERGCYFAHFYMVGTEGETFAVRLKTDKMAMSLGGVPMIFDYTKVLYNSRGC
jgi:radical SAM superfamily enzyme YgiQ (UPF0313 family)